VDRRSFFRAALDLLLAGQLIALAAWLARPLWRFVFPAQPPDELPDRQRVATAAEILPGTGRTVRFGSHPVLVLRTPSGELKALSGICTHLRCGLEYRSELAAISCPCHDGRFDLAGAPQSGPPTAALAAFRIDVQDGVVWLLRG